MEESFRDHANLIAYKEWRRGGLIYAEAMKHTDNARKFAEALEGVYATDPNYAEELIGLMDTYDLEQHDV